MENVLPIRKFMCSALVNYCETNSLYFSNVNKNPSEWVRQFGLFPFYDT